MYLNDSNKRIYKRFIWKFGIDNFINGSESKNNIIKDYCEANKIKQIFSSPRDPQTSEIIEIPHKEVGKFILNTISDDAKEIDLNNILLDTNHVNNYNIYTVTKFSLCELINYTDCYIYNEGSNNMNKE